MIHLKNRSKLVENSLFAITDLLQGAKFMLLYFLWRVGGGVSFTKLMCGVGMILYGLWGDDFYKKSQFLEKKRSFYFNKVNFYLLFFLQKP